MGWTFSYPGFSGFDFGSDSSGFDFGSGSSGFDFGSGSSGFDFGSGSSGFDFGSGSSGFNFGSGPSGFNFGSGSSDFNFWSSLSDSKARTASPDFEAEPDLPDLNTKSDSSNVLHSPFYNYYPNRIGQTLEKKPTQNLFETSIGCGIPGTLVYKPLGRCMTEKVQVLRNHNPIIDSLDLAFDCALSPVLSISPREFSASTGLYPRPEFGLTTSLNMPRDQNSTQPSRLIESLNLEVGVQGAWNKNQTHVSRVAYRSDFQGETSYFEAQHAHKKPGGLGYNAGVRHTTTNKRGSWFSGFFRVFM